MVGAGQDKIDHGIVESRELMLGNFPLHHSDARDACFGAAVTASAIRLATIGKDGPTGGFFGIEGPRQPW